MNYKTMDDETIHYDIELVAFTTKKRKRGC